MKLRELTETIATNTNVGKQIVNSVLSETFRQIRTTLDKGERLVVPEFGVFLIKNIEGEAGQPAKKAVKFKAHTAEKGLKKEKKGKKEGKREGKKREAKESPDKNGQEEG
jgi:nucleoid DNA-binding protein